MATVLAGLTLPAVSVSAQDGATGSPPESIDLTTKARAEPIVSASCKRRQEAALISGEIVVCAQRDEEDEAAARAAKDARKTRYAEKTMNKGTLPPPDVAGAGIFRGPATVGGICVKGIFNCPKAPALLVDVTALPQAPPGSDADRIARGLAPLGIDNRAQSGPVVGAAKAAELALPDPKATQAAASTQPPVSPAESAAPAAPR